MAADGKGNGNRSCKWYAATKRGRYCRADEGTPCGECALEAAATRPVLDLSCLNDPVIIDSIELLRKDGEHFLRVRSKDGAEGISVDNGRPEILQPILSRLVVPYFLGKEARDL
jgi:hypothetical protein